MALKIEEEFIWTTCSWPPVNDRFLSRRRHPRSRCVVQDEVAGRHQADVPQATGYGPACLMKAGVSFDGPGAAAHPGPHTC